MAALSQAVEPCIATYDTTTALCLAHCQVTFFFLFSKNWERESGGNSILPLEVPQMRLFICKDPFQEQASTIRGRREGPETVGFCGGNGSGRDIVDNNST